MPFTVRFLVPHVDIEAWLPALGLGGAAAAGAPPIDMTNYRFR